jgi:hypothetical protein
MLKIHPATFGVSVNISFSFLVLSAVLQLDKYALYVIFVIAILLFLRGRVFVSDIVSSAPLVLLCLYHIVVSRDSLSEFFFSTETLFIIILFLFFASSRSYTESFIWSRMQLPVSHSGFSVRILIFLFLQLLPFSVRFNPIIHLNENTVSLVIGLIAVSYLDFYRVSLASIFRKPSIFFNVALAILSIVLMDSRSVLIFIAVWFFLSRLPVSRTPRRALLFKGGLNVCVIILYSSLCVYVLSLLFPVVAVLVEKLWNSVHIALDVLSSPDVASLSAANTLEDDRRRLTLVVISIRVFLDNPLLGVGNSTASYLDLVRSSYIDGIVLARPHSALISFITSYGIIGFLSLCYFLFSVSRRYFLSVDLSVLGSVIVSSLFSDHFLSPIALFLLYPLVFKCSLATMAVCAPRSKGDPGLATGLIQ